MHSPSPAASRLAARAHKYALVRSLSHKDNNHLMSTHHVLTGHLQPGAFFDKVASRDDWPCYSAGCEYLRPRSDGIPSGVNLPTFLMSSPLTWPGQHAGFLGPKYDPWQIVGDPNSSDFRVDALTLSQGIDPTRLNQRRGLLKALDQQTDVASDIGAYRMTEDQRLAFTMLSSGQLSQAFELNREADDHSFLSRVSWYSKREGWPIGRFPSGRPSAFIWSKPRSTRS